MNYDELNRNYELLKKIIQPSGHYSLVANLDRIEKIIKEDIPRAFEKNAPADFANLYAEFVGEYERFHDFILFDKLIGKNVVALGGGFKSGKSTFLNYFIMGGDKILPTGIVPSTSVPAYIIYKKEEMIFGMNAFDAKIQLQRQDIKLISHRFGKSEEEGTDKITLGHLLKSIFIAVPNQEYTNIAFMDTPGYSEAESEHYSIKTDEKTEFLQLNSSNYVLWFIPADAGTISNGDIEFLSKLKRNIPVVIILNKADKRKNDINSIKDNIRNILDSRGIQYEDILAFSSKSSEEYDSKKILAYLNQWNKRVYESNFARNFKILFVKCKDYYTKTDELERKKLKLINEAIMYSVDEKVKDNLTLLQKESQANKSLIDATEMVRMKLEDEFFCEIKLVASKVGIKLPEPSEIALIQDKIIDPIKVLNGYIEKHNIKINTDNTVAILEDAFYDLNIVFNKKMGGSEFRNVLVEAIEHNLILERKEIHFNDSIYQDSLYDDVRGQIEQPINKYFK